MEKQNRNRRKDREADAEKRNIHLKQTEVLQPHDKGYKKGLSSPGEFLHFLKKYVGAEWMMELEDFQLSLCDKEMLEKDYEGREADLIYRVVRADEQEVYIFILQELQSSVDYTMIFRILIYTVNTLLKYFLDTKKEKRESADFRLPAMVPIVFYNGEDTWTAATSMREYQNCGEIFGSHILNLEYYLVDLSKLEREFLLSTNTVIDNILYCDKFRKKQELADAIQTAYGRIKMLGMQQQEAFRDWVRYILLSTCGGNRETVVEQILRWAEEGDGDMAFKYNIMKAFEDERAEGREEGKAEGKAECIITLLEASGNVPEKLRKEIGRQHDLETLETWFRLAARVRSAEEFERQMNKFEQKVKTDV